MLIWYYIYIRNTETNNENKNQTEVTKMTNVERATTIVNQLGGNKFLAMTGSKNIMALENGVRMDLVKNMSGANKLYITLNGLDLYDMKFIKYTPGRLNKKTFAYTDDKTTDIQEYEGIYADQLQELFKVTTGLDTTLFL